MLDLKQVFPLTIEPAAVQLVEAHGEWFVRVVEGSKNRSLRSFDRKRLAFAHAEVERARLGLATIERV